MQISLDADLTTHHLNSNKESYDPNLVWTSVRGNNSKLQGTLSTGNLRRKLLALIWFIIQNFDMVNLQIDRLQGSETEKCRGSGCSNQPAGDPVYPGWEELLGGGQEPRVESYILLV